MHLIENVLQRHRDKTILAVLIILSLSLLLLPQPAKLDLARGTLNSLFLPVERWLGFVDNYLALRGENLQLKRMVASLMLERQRLLQFRDERERLRRLAAFKEEQFYNLVPSEVIGRTIDRFQTTLVIDKGAQDSLSVGMPVFSYQGLVGKLTDVYDESAWVRLLCSKSHTVSCIDKRSRVVGVLEWRHRNQFELTSVSVVEDVAVGDTLLTSGFGGVVPKGFPVAVVTKVGPASDGLSLKVEARSQVNFLSLEEVFVMTDEVPWDRGIFYSEADTTLMRDILEDHR
jgi:rod shape-determining protein MreC